MKILVIISSILIAQTSASFFDVFQGAVLSVQNSFGKMISDVVSDVKETVDCTILAVEHALALSEDAAIRYYNKCGNTINNTVTVTETRHIESSPKEGVSIQYPSDEYLKKEIPAVIDAKINETLTKLLGSYNPSEKLRDVENVLAKETKELASVSNLVKKELKKVSDEVTSDLKNITNSHSDPSVESIMKEIKLLENKEQNSKNNSQATEIHQVIDDVLVKLDNLESTEATENVKLEHILKDLEFNSNSSFMDLRQQLQSWKEEESRHLDNIQTKILEHERNAQPNVHNNSLNLPPVQYDSDIRQTNVKEVNIISTKRISNTPRETSFNTSVNARNEQSHTLTLSKPKTNNNGHGNLSGVSSSSTSLKISQTTPNVSKDSDLKITVIRSKSYSMSKSVSINGKVHQVEGTTNSDKRSVHSTTHQPPTTMRHSHLDDNKAKVSIITTTTEVSPTTESNIFNTNYPGNENIKISSTEQPTSTSTIPTDITISNQSDLTTKSTKATEIDTTTNISIDNVPNSTTTSSDLVTEQSSTTQGISTTTPEDIKTTITDQPTTTVAETTTVSDTTAQHTTESENNAVDSSTLNEKEVSTTTEVDQTTTAHSVSDSMDDTVATTTSDKQIETTTVTESTPAYSTTLIADESTYSQTDQSTTARGHLFTYNVKTTTIESNKENLSEISTEQSIKSYEEEPTTITSETTSATDSSTVSPSEISSEHSTTLHDVTESSSVNIVDSEYTSSTVTTSIPDLTTEVLTSTTELSTNSNDEENTTTPQSVTTNEPVSITEETSEIITEHTTLVEAEISTVQTIKTLKPEVSTDNDPESNIEQSTTSNREEIITSVNPIDTETTIKLDLSTESPEITTEQTTTSDYEIITTENAVDSITTLKPDITTEAITKLITEQSTTCKEEPTTLNIVTTTEGDLTTESLSERHNETSKTPYDEEVPSSVSTPNPIRTTESDVVTESPSEEDTEKSTTTFKNHLSTVVPLHNVDPETTTKSDLTTESRSEYHTESNTEQTNNLNEEVVATEVNEVNALINKYSNDITTVAPVTVTKHHRDHQHIRTTTVNEELEDLTLPTTTSTVNHDFNDAPIITTSENILESTTPSRNIHTKVHHSDSKIVTSDVIEPITPSVHHYVTASTPLTTTESPYENKDNDLITTSTQRSRRTRKRNSTRSSRRRNSTTTVTEMPTTVPTTTNIKHTVITEVVPIAIKLLPVFRSTKTVGAPPVADHIHPHKDIPNTYVPHYKERRRPGRRNKQPATLNQAQQTVNKHEIQSSKHSVVQSGTHTNVPQSVVPENHDITRQNSMPQERQSRHVDEPSKATEEHHVNRATPHTITQNAHQSTTPRPQQSSKRNRTRRLDPVTDSPKPIRERTPDTITPANRKRGNRNTRRTNRPSNELTETAYRSRATTSKPVHAKDSYDMSPADYDAFFNIAPKNSPAHLEAVSRAHELISNSKRSDLIINGILKNKKRNGARSVFDILR